jgi:hypothetical protein
MHTYEQGDGRVLESRLPSRLLRIRRGVLGGGECLVLVWCGEGVSEA